MKIYVGTKRHGDTRHQNEGVKKKYRKTRPSWLNCALRGDEALYWVSIGHYEAVAVD